jgi:gas vesicle protein
VSDNHNASLFALMSFAMGILVGSVVTLLLAPISGRELRSRIGEEAGADWKRAHDYLAWSQAEVIRQMESLRQQLDEQEQRTQEQLNGQISQLQAKIDSQAT